MNDCNNKQLSHENIIQSSGVYSPPSNGNNISLSMRNCKRRWREAAIAEGKKPLTTRILSISCQTKYIVHFGILLMSYFF